MEMTRNLALNVQVKRNRLHLHASWQDDEVEEAGSFELQGQTPDKAIWNAISRLGRNLSLRAEDVHELYLRELPRLRAQVRSATEDRFKPVVMDYDEAMADYRRTQALGGRLSPILEAMYELAPGMAVVVEGMSATDVFALRRTIRRYLDEAYKVETARLERGADRYLAVIRHASA